MQRKMILSFSIFCAVIPLVDSSKKEILKKEEKRKHINPNFLQLLLSELFRPKGKASLLLRSQIKVNPGK